MGTLSNSPLERSRKTVQVVLQALASDASAASVAAAMGVSESTISRLKNDHLESFALLLAHLGLKVVPVGVQCYEPQYIALVHQLAMPEMQRRAETAALFAGEQ